MAGDRDVEQVALDIINGKAVSKSELDKLRPLADLEAATDITKAAVERTRKERMKRWPCGI